jgi:hypothetical protein
LPVLAKQFPKLALLKNCGGRYAGTVAAVFPRNPYHALEKVYKPMGREENDPLGDAVCPGTAPPGR